MIFQAAPQLKKSFLKSPSLNLFWVFATYCQWFSLHLRYCYYPLHHRHQKEKATCYLLQQFDTTLR